MFDTTNLVKDNDNEKYVYGGYGIAFDEEGSWSLNNDSARNVIILWIDNSSSSHTDNQKNDFLVLGKGPTLGINRNFGPQKKKLIFVKQRQHFVWVCIIMLIIVTYLWMEKKSINLKLVIKIITFHVNVV